MATTTLKTRIQHKYNTPAKWAEDTSFVPLKGEICVFNNGAGVKPEMKIGDGTTTLASLPFLKAGSDIQINSGSANGTISVSIDGSAKDVAVKGLGARAFDSTSYLPLSGGTMTGCITSSEQTFLCATSHGSNSYGVMFRKDSSGFYILLTDKGNTNGDWNDYRPFYIDLATGKCTIDGNITGTASSLNSKEPTLSLGHEYSAISIKGNANGALGIDEHLSLKTAIDFQWYNSNWQIGNVCSGSTPSAGFGFACKQEGEESFSLKARITPDSELILYNSANFYATLVPNNVTGYGNLRLTGTEKGGYYGIHLGDNVNYMTVMSGVVHQGLYNEANSNWIIYYNRENGRIGLGTAGVEGYTVTVGGSLKADNLYGTLHGSSTSCTGNAATATKLATARTISLTGSVTGSGSFDGSGNLSIATTTNHSHSHLTGWADTRDTKTTPNDYNSQLKVVGIKTPTGSGTLDGSTYSTLVGIRGWSDSSGGNSHELAFTGSGSLYRRHGSTTSWGSWIQILDSSNYTSYVPTKTGSGASGTWGINITGSSASCTGNAATASSVAWSGITGKPSTFTPSSHSHNVLASQGARPPEMNRTCSYDGVYTYRTTSSVDTSNMPTTYAAVIGFGNAAAGAAEIAAEWTDGMGLWFRSLRDYQDNWYSWKRIWVEGNSITGAVWNDYAEYRESDCAEFGRVLAENGDDTLSATTERLQHFAGISSDTWGFCQGETEKAKTPIAVAGRVLAYPYRDRDEYKPGDCVCAAPNGTVDIMTREEVEHYPDRIVGTVSCVPEYEEWGQGDRPAVKVDGRIWVKVR